jgi:hypothetical protein
MPRHAEAIGRGGAHRPGVARPRHSGRPSRSRRRGRRGPPPPRPPGRPRPTPWSVPTRLRAACSSASPRSSTPSGPPTRSTIRPYRNTGGPPMIAVLRFLVGVFLQHQTRLRRSQLGVGMTGGPARPACPASPRSRWGLPDASSRADGIAAPVAREDHRVTPRVPATTLKEGPMPYCEPHRTARARIIDLEIMRLELRRTSRPPALIPPGEPGTIVQFTRNRGAASPRRAA